jgi:hypothetical protein
MKMKKFKLKFKIASSAVLDSTVSEDAGISAGIFKQSLGAWNRTGIGLLYRPGRLHRLAE